MAHDQQFWGSEKASNSRISKWEQILTPLSPDRIGSADPASNKLHWCLRLDVQRAVKSCLSIHSEPLDMDNDNFLSQWCYWTRTAVLTWYSHSNLTTPSNGHKMLIWTLPRVLSLSPSQFSTTHPMCDVMFIKFKVETAKITLDMTMNCNCTPHAFCTNHVCLLISDFYLVSTPQLIVGALKNVNHTHTAAIVALATSHWIHSSKVRTPRYDMKFAVVPVKNFDLVNACPPLLVSCGYLWSGEDPARATQRHNNHACSY